MNATELTALIRRFWGRVDRGDDCWEWTGEKNNHGYGRFELWHGGRRTRVMAHRLALTLTGVELTDDDVVLHHCDNPPCVNPAHLRVGTQVDNMADARAKGRLNLVGLEAGHADQWPPRPCGKCGTEVTEGRKRYCPPCRIAVTRESQRRYAARQRLATRERAALKKARREQGAA